jgi:hypothetical protein
VSGLLIRLDVEEPLRVSISALHECDEWRVLDDLEQRRDLSAHVERALTAAIEGMRTRRADANAWREAA